MIKKKVHFTCLGTSGCCAEVSDKVYSHQRQHFPSAALAKVTLVPTACCEVACEVAQV